jgi:hypothetical protein
MSAFLQMTYEQRQIHQRDWIYVEVMKCEINCIRKTRYLELNRIQNESTKYQNKKKL